MQNLPLETTMEKMYSINNVLNEKRNMSSSKKENMFHSVFNILNILWEQFSKVPASFIANINYPLSVTVVNNDGIIPHDFFKDLSSKRVRLSTDNVYIQNVKESLNIVKNTNNDIFDEKKSINKIFNKNANDNLKFNYEYIGSKNKYTKRSDKKESHIKENIRYDPTNCNYLISVQNLNKSNEEEMFEYIYFDKNIQKVCTKENCYNFEDICNKHIFNKEQFFNYINNSMNDKIISFLTSSTNTLSMQPIQQGIVSDLFTKVLQKAFNNVTDCFYRTESVESDLIIKRSFSPKQRKKLIAVAKGRGRGRAKSQLRRSGVSQTRHRKERIKHDIAIDIENDFKTWQELKVSHKTKNKKLEDCFSLDEDTIDTVQYIVKETVNPVTYTFADIKPKIQKSKICRNINKSIPNFSKKMESIFECTEQTNIFHHDFVENRYNVQKNTFRPRLISESSIDSEDSYCIVFETGSEVTYKSDLEDSEENDEDQISEDEKIYKDERSLSPVQKVKFNLNPEIHIMVQWDYAYRAARKGPWEEMARDRERFRGRINCIERVLNPILTTQHRTYIWQERFASE